MELVVGDTYCFNGAYKVKYLGPSPYGSDLAKIEHSDGQIGHSNKLLLKEYNESMCRNSANASASASANAKSPKNNKNSIFLRKSRAPPSKTRRDVITYLDNYNILPYEYNWGDIYTYGYILGITDDNQNYLVYEMWQAPWSGKTSSFKPKLIDITNFFRSPTYTNNRINFFGSSFRHTVHNNDIENRLKQIATSKKETINALKEVPKIKERIEQPSFNLRKSLLQAYQEPREKPLNNSNTTGGKRVYHTKKRRIHKRRTHKRRN